MGIFSPHTGLGLRMKSRLDRTLDRALGGLGIGLNVDNPIDAAETLELLLRLRGSEAHCADNGPAGVAAAREFRPDVLILDLKCCGLLETLDSLLPSQRGLGKAVWTFTLPPGDGSPKKTQSCAIPPSSTGRMTSPLVAAQPI